jgi:hypothetical protein
MTMTRYDPPADPYASRDTWAECDACPERADLTDMTEIKPGVFLCRECQINQETGE